MPIGNIDVFKPDVDDWPTYKTRLNSWLEVNEITDAGKKQASLIAMLGGDAVRLLVNLCSPDNITDKSFVQLIGLFDTHFGRRNEVAEAYVFDTRTQSGTESIPEFVLALKQLSIHCNFGPSAQLKQKLRNRLVAGVRSDTIRQALIREGPTLTWDTAVTLATQMDDYQLSAMAQQSVTAEVKMVQHERRSNVKGPAAYRSQVSNNPAPSLGPPAAKAKYTTTSSRANRCWRCGKGNHSAQVCRFKEATCHLCGQVGHIKPVCNKGGHVQANAVGPLEEGVNLDCSCDAITVANTLVVSKSLANNPYTIRILVNDIEIPMEVDTGACISLIPYHMYERFFSDVQLSRSDVDFCSFTGDVVKCEGKVRVTVRHFGQVRRLWLHVLRASRFALVGRDWLEELRLNWQSIKSVVSKPVSDLDKLLSRYSDIFKGQGILKGPPAKLELIDGASPKRSKVYRVPIALQSTADRELDRLVSEGILTTVEHSEWSTSLLFIPKPDGSVRPCGDFKSTVNPLLKEVAPPQINMEDILCDLAGNQYFSNLDFTQAYNQMPIDEASRKLLTLVTHRGLYQYTRLPYGIKTAPSLWQRAVENVLRGIEGIHIYYDDILVAGRNIEEHNRRLELVFQRIAEHGLKLKLAKCSFLQSEVSYLGHVIDGKGTRPNPAKLDSILQTEAPKDKSKIRSYLGLLNFYRRYLPGLAETVAPMHALLKNHVKFDWSEKVNQSFEQSKTLLRESRLLVHYDPNLPVRLTCDASRIGVAAVLSHNIEGEDRPVQFASQKLTPTQVLYPQIEREGLAIIFGLEKFRHYLYGRKFVLVTDNQALSKIFSPEKGLPVMTAERIQRWALKLSSFDYSVEWKRSSENKADFLSRYPAQKAPDGYKEEQVAFVFKLAELKLPVTSLQVAKATSKDMLLYKVLRLISQGWPDRLCTEDQELVPFFNRRNELSTMSGVIMWSNRVVVPQSLRQGLLSELHMGHIGMSKMKSVARSFFWWPGLDRDIEQLGRSCESCMEMSNDPKTMNVHPWLPTSRPFQRIHVDYAGPIEGGNMLLVVVDSYSKWPEICVTKSTTSQSTIVLLRSIFARWGVPEEIVSDNGPQFSSGEFAEFTAHLNIRHKRGAPYHPATNGLAERFVQTAKKALKASQADAEDIGLSYRLDRFLLAYRNAPHSTTGESPANLMLGRSLRTRLDCVRPEVLSKQHDIAPATVGVRDFEIGALVWVRCYLSAAKWKPGRVIDKLGPLCYYVEVEGKKWKRHVDQLKRREAVDNASVLPVETSPDIRESVLGHMPYNIFSRNTVSSEGSQSVSPPEGDLAPSRQEPPASNPDRIPSQVVSTPSGYPQVTAPPEPRRSSRVSKPPNRLNL